MLVDIVVVKLYPVAFMPTDKAVRDPPWNEDEEQLRADQWNVSYDLGGADRQDKYTAESARLHDEMRKQLEKMEDLTEQICGVAQDTQGGHIGEIPFVLPADCRLSSRDARKRF
jgi:breast cancer 2 susceptibility protein